MSMRRLTHRAHRIREQHDLGEAYRSTRLLDDLLVGGYCLAVQGGTEGKVPEGPRSSSVPRIEANTMTDLPSEATVQTLTAEARWWSAAARSRSRWPSSWTRCRWPTSG
jgi:hypothetical protein